MQDSIKRPRVVILGGGFAGLSAARKLAHAPVDVVLVDRENHHLFQPLLYQVATAGLSMADIAAPIRRLLRKQKNTRVVMSEVVDIDVASKRVTLGDGELEYDTLVVALGMQHSYFGHDDWARYAPGLKTLSEALDIRRRVLRAYEVAEREPDPERRREWLTFVVVGAGPTGVELAGALAELSRFTVAGDFRTFEPKEDRIVLLDAADRVLQAFSESLSDKARVQLEKLGVEVRTGTKVEQIDEHGVKIAGDFIRSRTVIWAAGVRAVSLVSKLGTDVDRSGRVVVGPDLTIDGHPEVFVCGDAAAIHSNGEPVPGVAPAAIQAGHSVAKNILADLRGRPRKPFVYSNRGSLATIGRSAAVGTVFGRSVSGFVAWILWIFVHLLYLVTFRNRVVVLFSWAIAWFTYGRSARIIVQSEEAAHSPR
ncbi:MAG: NAD(P)/FAD-dependent oxidoreductase [Planctomycetes bacterium]|nr:NAD(P)/FAD-dependent oxidoreductase [Planctomycetota bacterium]